MTKSEIQCTNYIIEFFFKEFVYRNLYFYEGKQKLELCDGLIEFQDSYVIFQIKEKDTSTSVKWLNKKVYDKAVSQIKDSIGMIRRAENLQVESYAAEQITIDCTKEIIPVIIFDSDDKEYKQIHTSQKEADLKINIRMEDFNLVLNSLAIPYDIVLYLKMRMSFFENKLPHFFINEVSESVTTFARIDDEQGLIDYYIAMMNGNKYISEDAMKGFRFVIKNFSDRLIREDDYQPGMYKEVLECLIKSNRNTVHDFMLRWQICVEHCMRNEETIHHFLIDSVNDVGYLFFTQKSLIKDKDYIDFVINLFKYKFKKQNVIGVVFHILEDKNYSVEWMYKSYKYTQDDAMDEILQEEPLWNNAKMLDNY